MKLVHHGGECCGIRHIHGFGNGAPTGRGHVAIAHSMQLGVVGQTVTGVEALTLLLGYFENEENDEATENRLIEAVLTDFQDRNWRAALEEAGFRKIVRFQNDNTSNWCNIYHYYSDPERYQVFNAAMPAVPAVEPRPLPVPPEVPDMPNAHSFEDLRPGVRFQYQRRAEDTVIERWVGLLGTVTAQHGRTVEVRWANGGTNLLQGWQNCVPIDRLDRRHVFSTFHCVYRNNRRGAGYDSREAALEANPRAREVIERRIFSDGTTEEFVGE